MEGRPGRCWVAVALLVHTAMCAVVTKSCPSLRTMCPRADCDYGHVKDGQGCETCKCLPFRCPLLRCKPCPNLGFQTDSNGCQNCHCKVECRPVSCTNTCRYGYAVDGSGCDKCLCRARPQIMDPDLLDTLADLQELRVLSQGFGNTPFLGGEAGDHVSRKTATQARGAVKESMTPKQGVSSRHHRIDSPNQGSQTNEEHRRTNGQQRISPTGQGSQGYHRTKQVSSHSGTYKELPSENHRTTRPENYWEPPPKIYETPSEKHRRRPTGRHSADNFRRPLHEYHRRQPSDNYRRSSSDNYRRSSSDNYRRSSSDNYRRSSSDNYRRSSPDNYRRSSSDNYRRSSSDNYRPPSDNYGQPSDNYKRASQDNYRAKSSDNYRRPSSENYRRPLSNTARRDPSEQAPRRQIKKLVSPSRQLHYNVSLRQQAEGPGKNSITLGQFIDNLVVQLRRS